MDAVPSMKTCTSDTISMFITMAPRAHVLGARAPTIEALEAEHVVAAAARVPHLHVVERRKDICLPSSAEGTKISTIGRGSANTLGVGTMTVTAEVTRHSDMWMQGAHRASDSSKVEGVAAGRGRGRMAEGAGVVEEREGMRNLGT